MVLGGQPRATAARRRGHSLAGPVSAKAFGAEIVIKAASRSGREQFFHSSLLSDMALHCCEFGAAVGIRLEGIMFCLEIRV